jgi:hypothetical protein
MYAKQITAQFPLPSGFSDANFWYRIGSSSCDKPIQNVAEIMHNSFILKIYAISKIYNISYIVFFFVKYVM